MTINTKELKLLLDQNDFRLTNARLIIYEVFRQFQDKHLTLADIYQHCNDNNNHIGLATIYRTAKMYEDLGLIRKVNLGDNSSRYEVIEKNNDHFHLKCVRCNTIIEVKQSISRLFKNEVFNEMGFGITDFNLMFNGICKECRNAIAAS